MKQHLNLTSEDRHHLDAAEGWMGLGDFDEALAELGHVNPAARSHREVLEARWRINARAGHWEESVRIAQHTVGAFPGWPLARVQLGLSLYTVDRLEEATAVLETAVAQLGESPLLAVSLACCLGRLGDVGRARQIVERALDRHGEKAALGTFQQQTEFDLELESLWRTIEGVSPAH